MIEGLLLIGLIWGLVTWRLWPRGAHLVRVRRYNLADPPRVPDLLPLYWKHEGQDHEAGVNADRRRAADTDNERAVSAPGRPPQFHIGLEDE